MAANLSLTELSACYKAAPNIAVVKYWGKYSEDYLIPINDSIGFTLNSDDFCTVTSIRFGPLRAKHSILLNGKEEPISQRVYRMLTRVKKSAWERNFVDKVALDIWDQSHFCIESTNSFPTASGLASSASGLACLAAALNGLFGNCFTESELSEFARFGSGSACRSVFGGLVHWKGTSAEELRIPEGECNIEALSRKCVSSSVFSVKECSFIKLVVLMANSSQKEVSSTSGMQQSIATSQFISLRNKNASARVEEITALMRTIINARQKNEMEDERCAFNRMAQLIMKDSNQFHATCLDTYPPIFYLNAFSQQIIELVHKRLNASMPFNIAYTFDAGPHAVLIVHQSVLTQTVQFLQRTLKLSQQSLNSHAISALKEPSKIVPPISAWQRQIIPVYKLWVTSVGEGASLLGSPK